MDIATFLNITVKMLDNKDALVAQGATTVEFLLLLSEDDLKGLGVRPLHAKVLAKKAAELAAIHNSKRA